ncbi:PREDICTED: uncharacterized protein LOC108575943, partial [Habropoda laboriosa]|uniref:uncharacterized protein LOC108575943 n=1 Tax=Habropoda laboriosa TaxID=597456 RepID=UPI00083DDD6A
MAAMEKYYSDLSSIENVIRNWDPVRRIMIEPPSEKSRSRSARSRDVGILDTVREVPVNNFHVWYVKSSDPWQDSMYNTVVGQMKENLLAKSALPVEVEPEPDLKLKIYSILKSKGIERRMRKTYGDVYQLVSINQMPEVISVNDSIQASELAVQENHASVLKISRRYERKSTSRIEEKKSPIKVEDRFMNELTIESKDSTNSFSETIIEEPLRPRWILLPNESHRFKIRFQPEEVGHYSETYALTILDGNNVTYEVSVNGVADIPRIDINPYIIFPHITDDQLQAAQSSSYICDRGVYDFGSILVLRKDKRPHRRQARLKFSNISEVEAEVEFSVTENGPECFDVQPVQLFIAPGKCEFMELSAIATRLGIIAGRLHLCVKDNPQVHTIELQGEGTKLDIELEGKDIFFDRTLLYRKEEKVLTI